MRHHVLRLLFRNLQFDLGGLAEPLALITRVDLQRFSLQLGRQTDRRVQILDVARLFIHKC